MDDDADRRAPDDGDRRRGDRRRSQLAIFAERRFGERRRVPRRLIDAFRSFLGLPPLEE